MTYPDGTCGRGGEPMPCTCYTGPDFTEMTRPELEAAAERWRQRAITAEQTLYVRSEAPLFHKTRLWLARRKEA